MNYRNLSHLYKAVLFVSFCIIAFACEDNSPELEVKNNYLIDYELLATVEAEQLKLAAQIFQPGYDVSAISYDSEIYKVSYKAEHQGDTVKASGLICIPLASKNDDFPFLLGFHPSIGSQSEAPSNYSGTFQSGLELFAALGYVAIIPDYIGFGESGSLPHPYLIEKSVGKNSELMLRAAVEMLEELEQNYSQELSFIGYSQGGYNTVAALNYFENEAQFDSWQLTAAAAGGAVFDLHLFREQLANRMSYESPESLGYLIYAYHEYYELSGGYDQYFQDILSTQIPYLYGNELTLSQIRSRLSTDLSKLLNEEFRLGLKTLDNNAFDQALSENSIAPWRVKAPLHIFHASQDSVISIENSKAFYEAVQSKGSQAVEFTELTTPDSHSDAGAPMLLAGVLWLLEMQEN
ncbi:lipase family protein [Porifericola rhodea]|uniref:alpha/beta hydrolase family protein n=1 Tax=Porifericola rhodea TaxID=930972 RepID=UPI002666DCB7|nr:lipase family protein [Porifericola rhodea]WKN30983.1 lipase family protein [Porifericola rhodea]